MHSLKFAIQGILTAVLSTVLGTKDQDQVASMAKQAGEVSTHTRTSLHTLTFATLPYAQTKLLSISTQYFMNDLLFSILICTTV